MKSADSMLDKLWPFSLSVADVVLFLVMSVHVAVSPFTKVEESFNIQAIHDLLHHQENITQYDHLEFPGVVPRTFLGPLVVAALLYPAIYIDKFLGFTEADKLLDQIKARLVLGVLVWIALYKYKQVISKQYGQSVGKWLMLIMASQFHLVFYMTRPLPNIFALIVVLFAVKYWLSGQHSSFIWCSALSVVVFRAELGLLLGLMLILELWSRRLSLSVLFINAIPAGIICLGLTILVDSYFWQRWLWPEGEVLWFNTVLNKSSQWGTQPYLWYLYNAIPRALLASIFLVFVGLYIEKSTLKLFLPSLCFVLLFSILPHKELRFIIYVLPIWNTVAAVACDKLWQKRSKSMFHRLLALAVLGHLAVNMCATLFFTSVSHYNYPGGYAMQRLHTLESAHTDVDVHLDVLACQTGISRFTQLYSHWRYDKTEDLTPGGLELQSFTHLIISASDLHHYTSTHTVLDTFQAYSGLDIHIHRFPPVNLVLKPVLVILKRKAS